MLEIRGSQASLTLPQISPLVFRAAYKELCARIWIELELLAMAGRVGHRPGDPVISAAILRLELVVLVDCCRSPRWRGMLSADQCDSLCSMLTDVLAALYVDAEYLPMGIAIAQDRVLDELLPDTEIRQSPADPTFPCELGHDSHPGIHELVSLMETQAAARAIPSMRQDRSRASLAKSR